MSTYMTLEEYTATLKVGDEVTIKYYSIFNEIQSKNMENINQIKNKIHEIEEQIKQYEQQMRKKG